MNTASARSAEATAALRRRVANDANHRAEVAEYPTPRLHFLAYMPIITVMPLTREESDAWLIMQGDTQERLDRIHAAADIMRARLEAEGRGPSTVWEPASSDDEEFGDIRPMTPPASPPRAPRGRGLTYPRGLGSRSELHNRRHI